MSEDPYFSIAKLSPYGHFIYDIATREFRYVNNSLLSLLEINLEDIQVDAVKAMIHNDDREFLESSFRNIRYDHLVRELEFRVNTSKEVKRVVLTAYYLSTGPIEQIIGYVSDITAEYNNVENLKKFANKKDSVLNILAHDLKGPLGMANTLVQALEKRLHDPELANLTRTLTKVLKQSIDLIVDLTNREFLETTEVELVKSRIDIAKKIKEYIDEFFQLENITNRKILFSTSSEAVYIALDEPKFIQILNNLISNSLKFTSENGEISIRIEENSETVLFTVADNGIGIPKEFHESLFEKFSDARRRGLQGEPSVGLGLSIVKTIVEWHNGTIWFESEVEKGTTFFIEIPK